MRSEPRKYRPHLKVAKGWCLRVIVISDKRVIDWDDYKHESQALVAMPSMLKRVREGGEK